MMGPNLLDHVGRISPISHQNIRWPRILGHFFWLADQIINTLLWYRSMYLQLELQMQELLQIYIRSTPHRVTVTKEGL